MSDLSERYDANNKDDDGTGDKDNSYNKNRDGRGDTNNGSGGGSAKLLRFLIPSALIEALGTMAKAKASLFKNEKKTKVGKK